MLKKYFLVSYELKELKQKDKMKLLRTLFGYSSKKAGKVYFQKGVVDGKSMRRVGVNTLMVSEKSFSEIKILFRKFDMNLNYVEVFVK